MPFYDVLKNVYEGVFAWIQGKIIQRHAAQHLADNLQVLERTAKAAAELIGATDELAASDDPHKKRLAALIKDYATEGFEQVTKGRLSAKEVAAIEPDHPFSENSEPSRASLPGTPKPSPTPKALPHTPPQPQPSPPKRGRGRPRKNPQENPQA